MTNNDLDNLFRETFSDHEVPFNPKAWDKADKMLAARKAQRRKAFFYKAAAAAAFLITTATAAIYFMNSDSTNELQADSTAPKIEKQEASAKLLENVEDATASKSASTADADMDFEADESKADVNKADVNLSSGTAGSAANRMNEAIVASQQSVASSGGSASRLNNNNPVVERNVVRESLNRNIVASQIIEMDRLGAEISLGQNDKVLDVDPDYTILSEMPDFKPVIKHRLGVLAGGSVSQGFAGGTNAGDISVDPHFGLTYEYLFSPSISFEVNALYRLRSNSGLLHEESFSLYSFGRTDYHFTLENGNAGYLELPVFVNWNVNSKHQVKLGASASYLLHSSENSFFEVESPYTEDFSGMIYPVIEDGQMLKKWDFALQAGYEFEVFSNLSFGARAYYGLGDIAAIGGRGDAPASRNKHLSGYVKYRVANL